MADVSENEKGAVLTSNPNHYLDLLLSSNNIIIRCGTDGVIRYINDFGLRFFGYSSGELLGQNVMTIVPNVEKSTGRDLEALVKDILNNPQEFESVPNENIRKDGKTVWVVWTNKPILDDQGKVQEILTIGSDITALQETKLALRKREERYRDLLHTAMDGHWLVDIQGHLLEVNAAYCRMSGYSEQELLTMHVTDLEMNENAEVVAAHIQKIMVQGQDRFESRHRRKDGVIFDVEACVQYRAADGGQFVGFFRDITDRKRAEEMLRESSSNLRTLHESMRDAFVSVDMDGRLLDFNSSYLELLGYPEEELRSKTYVDLTPEKWHDFEKRIVAEQVLPRGFSDVYEKEYRHKDGTLIPIELRTVLIRDSSGKPELMWAIIRDINERKRTEAALIEAKYLAEQANQAKSQFLANMSHEIRTPLTAIVGFAELLADTGLSEEQHRYLGNISSSSENLLLLINDILDLSRIETGKFKLRSKELHLREIVDEVLVTQALVAQSKGLEIGVDIPDAVPDNLTGDPIRVKQILLNLVGNAIKFTERGEITIAVAVEEQHSSAVLLRIDVIDTGIGIGPEHLTNIFIPFSQVDSSSTRQYGGTGLGLAICAQLASLMGGEIWVDSQLDAGSTFHVRVPFVVNNASSPSCISQHVDQPLLWLGGPLHVLLVEDNETNRLLFTQMLEKYGHSVDVAENGAICLEKWRQTNYDIVLMDVQMPVMDGIEAAMKIREMERGRDTKVPIIALTAHAMKSDRVNLMNKEFDGYLSKPMTVNDLLGEIKRCLPKQ